jgi:hypothetical protein
MRNGQQNGDNIVVDDDEKDMDVEMKDASDHDVDMQNVNPAPMIDIVLRGEGIKSPQIMDNLRSTVTVDAMS